MILDTSAVVGVLVADAEEAVLRYAMASAPDDLRIGAPTLVETSMVMIGRFGPQGRLLLGEFMNEWRLDVLTFSEAHWRAAQTAFSRFGKGRHPAGLNFGDCLSYATAWIAAEPLLCIGDDFAQTDLELVALS